MTVSRRRALLTALAAVPGASAQPAPSIGATDIGGVVTGPGAPEAGVWVITETMDLGIEYARTVVADEAGRYLTPPACRRGEWMHFATITVGLLAAFPNSFPMPDWPLAPFSVPR